MGVTTFPTPLEPPLNNPLFHVPSFVAVDSRPQNRIPPTIENGMSLQVLGSRSVIIAELGPNCHISYIAFGAQWLDSGLTKQFLGRALRKYPEAPK